LQREAVAQYEAFVNPFRQQSRKRIRRKRPREDYSRFRILIVPLKEESSTLA
jgi:hypothetical protein